MKSLMQLRFIALFATICFLMAIDNSHSFIVNPQSFVKFHVKEKTESINFSRRIQKPITFVKGEDIIDLEIENIEEKVKSVKETVNEKTDDTENNPQIVDLVADEENGTKEIVAESSDQKSELKTISGRYNYDNGLVITTDDDGRVTAVPKGRIEEATSKSSGKQNVSEQNSNIGQKSNKAKMKNPNKFLKEEIPKPVVSGDGFNVVLTHCTADFDTLASAVGLAKLWSNDHPASKAGESSEFESTKNFPTFVVLPRGAHPAVHKFLSLHKHLFPIRSLKSLPSDLSGLNRLGLVDAQKRERVGPAEFLIASADRVTIVDHHVEGDSDIHEATDYIVDEVGSVSAMIAEQLRDAGFELSEAEATLLALGIHADTGSLCYDSTTVRDAEALAWVMSQGASQAAIAEHAHSTLSQEQQSVLTNALINTNSTLVHGVTVSTVLLR